ncbi:holo-(acyl carrier protein) synthase 2 [Citrobacter koseri]|nr:holo-(acyl carrier protein) synthase 2 [Citrobacter koseri]
MYRIVLGKVSTLSTGALPSPLYAQAPQGARRARWLAGRVLLSHALSPLPEIVYGEQGKPAFSPDTRLWFNLSHSGDDIALLLSDEGEVGCDIEVIRPRDNWRSLANAVFSLGEHAEVEAEHPEQQLAAFLAHLDAQRGYRKTARRQRLANRQRGQHAQLGVVGQPVPARYPESGGLHADTVHADRRLRAAPGIHRVNLYVMPAVKSLRRTFHSDA